MPNFDGTGPRARSYRQMGRGLGPCKKRQIRRPRRLCFKANFLYFKPAGLPLTKLEENILDPDELEALKLYYLDNLDQTQTASKMQISQATIARTLKSAGVKITDALINGKAIAIGAESGS